MSEQIARAFRPRRVLILCLVLLGGRLASLPLYPLFDRTESRYAEIAREIHVTQDWIVPPLLGEPFWGKPPLSMWAMAAGIEFLGRNELAVRLPAYLVGLLTIWLVWKTGLILGGRYVAAGGALLFCCSPISLFMAGGVMTDPYLGFGMMLAFYGLIARVVPPPDRQAGAWRAALLVAVGLGIAVLAKGPIGVVLGGCAFAGLLAGKAGRDALRAWPWIRTIVLFACVAVPWFLLAEQRTPGFLDYFLVGENFRRYVDSDWAGDRYGTPHTEPYGMIWAHLLLATLAWLPLAWVVLRRERPAVSLRALGRNPGWAAAAGFALLPLVFFTFSRNILHTYVYPSLAPLALLLSYGIQRGIDHSRTLQTGARTLPLVVCVIALGLLVALPFVPSWIWVRQSHRDTVKHVSAPRIVYARELNVIYSPIFYSDGRAVGVDGVNDPTWEYVRANPTQVRVLTRRRNMGRVPADVIARLELERDVESHYQIWRVRAAVD